MSPRIAILALSCCLIPAAPAGAQTAFLQDSTLNNLDHAPGYVTAPLGTLGGVVERGTGKVDMILVSGSGMGASAFEGFMKRNDKRYHMLAVTLPGFEGTPAPPMPPPGTSYGDQTWTHAAAEAIVGLIQKRRLHRPIVVGHYVNGSQVAMQVAVAHPELVRALVLLAGTPRYEPVKASRFWPKNLTLEQKVKAVDQFSAPRWFKTVTRETWDSNNWQPTDLSVVDSARGVKFRNMTNAAPLPVLIRYLCEFHASDLWPDLDRLQRPMLLVQPHFTASLRADTTRSYLAGYLEEPWRGRLEGRPHTETLVVDNAGIMVMEDQPAVVDRRVADFVKRQGK